MYTFEPTRSYSVPEAAKLLGISRAAVAKRIKAGTLSAERVGRNYAIKGVYLSAVLKLVAPPTGSSKERRYEMLQSIFGNKIPPEHLQEADERFSAYIRFIARMYDRLVSEGRGDELRARLDAARKGVDYDRSSAPSGDRA